MKTYTMQNFALIGRKISFQMFAILPRFWPCLFWLFVNLILTNALQNFALIGRRISFKLFAFAKILAMSIFLLC